ncbi:MAG: DNA primase [Proteobacteria bacterium]|nr:DNA primase [Pseudomonadota bacterium]MDA0982817.1 DNA primase [Pseudomonadota bacterium]
MIPDSFKQDLLNRVDVVDVVSRFVQLKKAGANLQGLCPFHTEKSPSFTVSPAKQFYHCFGCGAHGNAIGFLMAYSSLGYVDAIKDLASGVGMQVPEWQPSTPEAAARKERETDLLPLMEKAMDFYRDELKKSPHAIEYLKGRGLSGEIAARFRIGYAPDDWQGLKGAFPDYEDKALVDAGLVVVNEDRRYDRFRDRVMFPIHNARGAVIGFGGRVLGEGEPKYLNSPETPLFQKGREVYGLVQARDAIRAAGRALVVEGYMDVVALAQFGVGYAVATLGTATTPVHVSKLLRLADELVFCFDGDAAGRKAAWRALEVSLPLAADAKPVKFLFLPEKDDPDSYIRAHGKEAFERMVTEAQPLSAFLIAELQVGLNLGSAEGRSQFVARANPHLQKVTAQVLRLQIGREIARLSGLAVEDIQRLIAPGGAPSQYQNRAPARSAPPLTLTQERNLLRCVLSRPSLAAQVEDELLDPELLETAALRAVAEFAPEEGVSGAVLVERFQGTEFEQIVFKVMASAMGEEIEEGETGGEGVAREFHQIQLALRIKRKNQEIDALTRQVGSSPANPALVVELNQRVKELHQLKAKRA